MITKLKGKFNTIDSENTPRIAEWWYPELKSNNYEMENQGKCKNQTMNLKPKNSEMIRPYLALLSE